MTAIVSLFWRICTFRCGPDLVPANSYLLALVVLANALVGMLSLWGELQAFSAHEALAPLVPQVTAMQLVTLTIVEQAGCAALTWTVLYLLGFASRFPQTLMALFGVDTIITAAAAVGVSVGLGINPLIGGMTELFSLIWRIAAFGYIFHRALNIALGFGIATAIFVMLFSIAIAQVVINP